MHFMVPALPTLSSMTSKHSGKDPIARIIISGKQQQTVMLSPIQVQVPQPSQLLSHATKLIQMLVIDCLHNFCNMCMHAHSSWDLRRERGKRGGVMRWFLSDLEFQSTIS